MLYIKFMKTEIISENQKCEEPQEEYHLVKKNGCERSECNRQNYFNADCKDIGGRSYKK